MPLPIRPEKIDQRLIVRALLLGLVGGMRSWTPPTTIALTYDTAPADSGWKRWPVFSSRGARLAWTTLGAVEYIADKWPRTIPRTRLRPQPTHTDGGLIGRTAVAALATAALGSEYEEENSVVAGAVIGAVAALLSNIAFYHLRKELVEKTQMPDGAIAMIEDEIAVGLAIVTTRIR